LESGCCKQLTHSCCVEQTQGYLDSAKLSSGDSSARVVGTPDYLAPEVLLGLGHGKCCNNYDFMLGMMGGLLMMFLLCRFYCGLVGFRSDFVRVFDWYSSFYCWFGTGNL
jgi:serine/threonine protein kinase